MSLSSIANVFVEHSQHKILVTVSHKLFWKTADLQDNMSEYFAEFYPA